MAARPSRWCQGEEGVAHKPVARMDPNHSQGGAGCLPAAPGEPSWWNCYHRSYCERCGKFLNRRVSYCPTIQQDLT